LLTALARGVRDRSLARPSVRLLCVRTAVLDGMMGSTRERILSQNRRPLVQELHACRKSVLDVGCGGSGSWTSCVCCGVVVSCGYPIELLVDLSSDAPLPVQPRAGRAEVMGYKVPVVAFDVSIA